MNPLFLVGSIVFAAVDFILLLGLSFIAWMAIDAGKGDKYWWLVFILGAPLIGATVYFFIEKKHDYMKLPQTAD